MRRKCMGIVSAVADKAERTGYRSGTLHLQKPLRRLINPQTSMGDEDIATAKIPITSFVLNNLHFLSFSKFYNMFDTQFKLHPTRLQ